jgi:hypothetical protein
MIDIKIHKNLQLHEYKIMLVSCMSRKMYHNLLWRDGI